MRRLYHLAGTALIVAALLLVPLPLLVLSPGPVQAVTDRLVLEGPQLEPVHGDLLLTAVSVSEPTPFGVALAIADPDRELVAREVVIPEGQQATDYFEAQRDLFVETTRTAVAAGLQAAGRPVSATGEGARVVALAPETAPGQTLRQGDVIIAVDGQPVPLATDVVTAVADHEPGETVELIVRRRDATVTVEVPVRQIGDPPRPGIGAVVTTVAFELALPIEVGVDAEGIGGPSAGLPVALAAYDRAEPGDLIRGRRIAATGTVGLPGTVGAVGGVRQKAAAAERAGADIFVVPAAERDEALDATGAVEVVAVATLAEAITALGR